MRFVRAIALAGLVCAMSAIAGSLRAQAPQALFRAGVDLVQVDVSVLDKNRQPVLGLTAADFTVKEDGKPRPIEAFEMVTLPERPAAPPGAAAWTREVAADVATNEVPQEGRLVVIMFDWSIRFQDQVSARKIAAAAVDTLGPADLAAVTFTSAFANAGTRQNFTSDHAKLLAAVNAPIAAAMQNAEVGNEHDSRNGNDVMLEDPEGYESGDCGCRLCVLDAVTHVADVLRDVPGRRKILLFIGTFFQGYQEEHPVRNPPPQGISPYKATGTGSRAGGDTNRADPGYCAGQLNEARQKMERAARLANLTVDSLDPVGLTSGANDPLGGGIFWLTKRQNDLHLMPDATGGRTVVNTNAPEAQVPAIFEESHSYYLLAFSPANHGTDGKTHSIDVQVKRSGVAVQARNAYVATAARVADRAAPADLPLAQSLDRVLPRSDLSLEIAAAPFAGSGADPAVAVVVGIREPERVATSTEDRPPSSANIVTAAFDDKGRSVGRVTETVRIAGGALAPPTGYEVLSRLSLPPGRYEIRTGVDRPPDQRGSVYTFVDVPNFAREAVSLSGISLGVTPADPATPANLLSDLVPFVPTVRRVFHGTDVVAAYAVVAQGGSSPVGAVEGTARIVDIHDAVMFQLSLPLTPDRFTNRAAACQVSIPTAGLAAGEYLLIITATRGSASARRDVRFSIR